MSLTTLPPRVHPVLGALAVLGGGLDALAAGNLWSLSDAELLAARVELGRLSARLAAAALGATRELDVRGAAVAAGATSLTAWLVTVLGLHPGEAGREVALAAALGGDLPATAAGLAAGDLTPAAATVIADTDTALAATATAAERRAAEALLAGHAPQLTIRELQAAALHLRHRLDPGRGERMAREEDTQVARRELRLHERPDGSCGLAGTLDKEAAAFLRTALDPLAAPRAARAGQRDPRSAAHRRADALVELVELALRSGQLPTQAAQPVQLVVAIDLDDLQQRAAGAGAGELDLGMPLSAQAVRRLACDAQLVPAVLGARGEPLDVGRAQRTVPPSLRRALELRDRGCAFPGCDRPARWTQAHHIEHWADGGATATDNCVLLCAAHHRAVHHSGWRVRIEPDHLPSFYPPAWIDPEQRARRNLRLLTAQRQLRDRITPRIAPRPIATITPIQRT